MLEEWIYVYIHSYMYKNRTNKQEEIKYWLRKYAKPDSKARGELVAAPVAPIANSVCTSAELKLSDCIS